MQILKKRNKLNSLSLKNLIHMYTHTKINVHYLSYI